MNELVEFLLACIAEEENDARAAIPEWASQEWVEIDPEQAAHIARWDPARVLAECEVKQVLIKETQKFDTDPKYDAFGAEGTYAWLILTNLALPYADDPDFRQEWRP